MRVALCERGARRLALAAFLVAYAAIGLAARHGGASEQELRELRGRIEKLQAGLAAAEKSSGEAADQLRESGKAVSEAHRSLFELSQRRRALEGELEVIAKRDGETRSGISAQEALAGKLLRLQYQQGAPDRLRLALEGRDPATLARHLQYYNYVQRSRAEVIGQLRRKAEELAGLARDAAARREELAQNEAASADEARVLERERAARAAVVARLANEMAQGRREIGKLKRDEVRLSKLVEDIARTLAARRPEGRPVPGKAIDSVADASAAAKPFEALRGRLKLPVLGELVNRYGSNRDAGSTWKGLFIRAVSGETVRAVADGRVVYADWLRGFGNLMILDHGKGYMSLYAYNEGLLRQVGEKVRGGDAVAQVGASGGSEESGLYFELRRDGKPFDPLRWVAQ
ncbi:MAG: peptidoglycan DD-metalloendopeptidase family protein [Pseudomonadota bacterium]|nr:peptidoglycan DD-metalloendopeptidase family protein [Pseudomonadota bacterium]